MDVIAHRGARLLALENSLEAFRVAWEEGADAIELDVQLTADGEPVVFHDETLAAWTGDERPIVDQRWRDLRLVRLVDERGNAGTMPHLDEVLEMVAAAPGWVNIELKTELTEGDPELRLADTVAARLESSKKIVVSSFSKVALSRFASCLPAVQTAVLIHDRPDWPWSPLAAVGTSSHAAETGATQALLGASWNAVHPHGLIVDRARLAAWQGHGLAVRPWVVNEPVHWHMCRVVGVDGVITDDPGGLRGFLENDG
jgi:glycerophosphoryl diester phosphodiesterase